MKLRKIFSLIIILTVIVITGCNKTVTTDLTTTTTTAELTTTTTESTTTTQIEITTTDQIETSQIVIHYNRENDDYNGWNLWIWETLPSSSEGVSYNFTEEDDYGIIARIPLTGQLEDATLIGLIPRLYDFADKDVHQDRFIDMTNFNGGELHIWITEGDSTLYYSIDEVGTRNLDNLDLNFTSTDHTGVYYEIFVRSFADSNNDGVGDYRGITNNLPYLSDLGIEGIWLMPMLESSSYHGYDVTNYYAVEKDYGTMADFEHLLQEAERYGIKIIIDLVINHTSAQHPWFVSARNSRTSVYRDWYVWIDSNNPLYGRKGAWGQTIWHYASGQNYAGYFWDQMPDLNMQNEEVKEELKNIGRYWLEKGVDGFRLDAAMHMFGKNEYPDTVEYAKENVLWWYEFRTALQQDYPDMYLVGEIWENPHVISPYFKGLHSAFNFDISQKILNVVKSNSSSGYASGLDSIYDIYRQSNPTFFDAPFLTNHDEDRIASQVNNEDDLKLAADMLLMLSGNPFIYYGEEIGMKGYKSNGPIYDETRRLPFIWSRNSNSSNTYWIDNSINDEVASVEEQLNDPSSLLNHYKTLIELRKNNLALAKGEFIEYNTKSSLISYLKHSDTQTLLVIHNPTTYDISLNLNTDNFTGILYNSNTLSDMSTIHSNSTIVLEINDAKVNEFINR